MRRPSKGPAGPLDQEASRPTWTEHSRTAWTVTSVVMSCSPIWMNSKLPIQPRPRFAAGLADSRRSEAHDRSGPAEWDRRRGGRPCCTSTSCRRVHHRPLGPPTAPRRSAPRGRGLTLTLTDHQVTAQPSLGLRRGEGRHCANCGTLVRWRILRLSAPLPHRSTTNRAQCSAPGQAGSNCSGIRRGR